jgi:predicted double-glycine peptidase
MSYNKPHLILNGLLFVVIASFSVNAIAANIQIGGIVPGAGMINKNLISMRESHFVNMVPQQTDFSCGAAALATILNYAYGHNVTEEKVIEGLLAISDPEVVKEKGFSLLDLKNYVERLGMRGRGYGMKPEMLQRIKIPTIVLLDIRGYKHFVVVKKTTEDKVYIADPALGNRIMDKEDFVAGWNQVTFAIIGDGFDRESILLRPKEPLTARNIVDTWRPLTNAQLAEYGFRRAEYF